jgi:hypothetical protein
LWQDFLVFKSWNRVLKIVSAVSSVLWQWLKKRDLTKHEIVYFHQDAVTDKLFNT